MGQWNEDSYKYNYKDLERIAIAYKDIHSKPRLCGVSYDRKRGGTYFEVDHNLDMLRLDILSSKVDFDRALNAIGKGNWSGTHFGDKDGDTEFKTYKPFGRAQQVVIADILGIMDWELERLDFYEVSKFKVSSYKKMAHFLNYGLT